MSHPPKNRKVPAEHVQGPVKQGSVLHRILEVVARRTAERLANDSPETKQSVQRQKPQRSRQNTA